MRTCSSFYYTVNVVIKQDMGGVQYLMSPKVWQTVEHSMSHDWILFLPQFEQQNRDEGRDL